jgi:hypothetical protein
MPSEWHLWPIQGSSPTATSRSSDHVSRQLRLPLATHFFFNHSVPLFFEKTAEIWYLMQRAGGYTGTAEPRRARGCCPASPRQRGLPGAFSSQPRVRCIAAVITCNCNAIIAMSLKAGLLTIEALFSVSAFLRPLLRGGHFAACCCDSRDAYIVRPRQSTSCGIALSHFSRC